MPIAWLAASCLSVIMMMVSRVFSGIIDSCTTHLSQVFMVSSYHYFIAKFDIVFLGRLDHSFLSLMMTSVICYTLPSCVCFMDSHLYHRSSDEGNGRKYVSKHFLSSGMVFLLSGVSVLIVQTGLLHYYCSTL
jgi:hypothetical protein